MNETVQELERRMDHLRKDLDLKHSEIMKRMDSIQTSLDPVVDNNHIMLRYLEEKKAIREPDFKKSLLSFYFNITSKVFLRIRLAGSLLFIHHSGIETSDGSCPVPDPMLVESNRFFS